MEGIKINMLTIGTWCKNPNQKTFKNQLSFKHASNKNYWNEAVCTTQKQKFYTKKTTNIKKLFKKIANVILFSQKADVAIFLNEKTFVLAYKLPCISCYLPTKHC